MDSAQYIYHDFCLVGIDFVRYVRLLAEFGRDENHAMRLQCVVEAILRWEWVVKFRLQLVWTRYRLQLLPAVEHLVRELGYLWVHTSLTAKDADEVGALLVVFPVDESLEEGVAAVSETDVLQDAHVDGSILLAVADGWNRRILFALLYHGRQLLVVADEDELIHGGEQSDEVGLQYLARLVDDGELEVLQGEDEWLRGHHRGGAHDNSRTYYILLDGFKLRTIGDSFLYQIRAESLVARVLASQAEERNARIHQHLADFIHGSVGVAHQKNRGCWLLNASLVAWASESRT